MKELTEAVIYFMHSSKIEILKICVKFIKKVLSLGLELNGRKESLTDFLPWVLWNCSNKDDNSFFHATVWSFFNTWETIYISFHNNIQNDDSALVLAKLWIENKVSST